MLTVIEIPKGSRNKYEIDHTSGAVWLDRMLFTSTMYPTDYGFIEGTLAEDGDPLDVLVLLDEPTFPGCHIRARPIGAFMMEDEKGRDTKILAVPSTDPRWASTTDVTDVPPFLLAEIKHFFDVYKELEPGKSTVVRGWEGAETALREIEQAIWRAEHSQP
jgi:inorganic pyrophosphatase